MSDKAVKRVLALTYLTLLFCVLLAFFESGNKLQELNLVQPSQAVGTRRDHGVNLTINLQPINLYFAVDATVARPSPRPAPLVRKRFNATVQLRGMESAHAKSSVLLYSATSPFVLSCPAQADCQALALLTSSDYQFNYESIPDQFLWFNVTVSILHCYDFHTHAHVLSDHRAQHIIGQLRRGQLHGPLPPGFLPVCSPSHHSLIRSCVVHC